MFPDSYLCQHSLFKLNVSCYILRLLPLKQTHERMPGRPLWCLGTTETW